MVYDGDSRPPTPGLDLDQLLGTGPSAYDAKRMLPKAAHTDAPVLILGEPGTGKELVARAIHERSPRAGKPMITVNAAAITGTLIESELFGHVKGAYTGALQSKQGLFERAHQGTLFLDEIGDLPLEAQAKILRALEYGDVHKVGAETTIRVDVRVIAATNKNLDTAMRKDSFRPDLYYRLAAFEIMIPPLRERREDIPRLIEYFLARLPEGRRKTVSQSALDLLIDYPWPGNIRQLKCTIERMATVSDDDVMAKKDIPQRILAPPDIESQAHHIPQIPPTGFHVDHYLKGLEKAIYQETLRIANGNAARASRLLNIKEHTFRERLRSLGMRGDSTTSPVS